MKVAFYIGLAVLCICGLAWWFAGSLAHWYDEATEPGRCRFGHERRRYG
jgi:hypothetical protein